MYGGGSNSNIQIANSKNISIHTCNFDKMSRSHSRVNSTPRKQDRSILRDIVRCSLGLKQSFVNLSSIVRQYYPFIILVKHFVKHCQYLSPIPQWVLCILLQPSPGVYIYISSSETIDRCYQYGAVQTQIRHGVSQVIPCQK